MRRLGCCAQAPSTWADPLNAFILGADPDEEQDRIGGGEDEGDPGKPKAKGQGRDFANDDDIVRMRDNAVGAVRHQGRARKDDDARGPARAKRHEKSKPAKPGATERREPGWIDHARRAENPKTGQPERVHQHDRRIVSGSDLDGALRQERRRVAAGEIKFRDPLRGDQSEKEGRGRHAALFRETQLEVKPGPIAVSNVREGRPARRTRSSTNSTVGDDMLP